VKAIRTFLFAELFAFFSQEKAAFFSSFAFKLLPFGIESRSAISYITVLFACRVKTRKIIRNTVCTKKFRAMVIFST